MVLPSWQLMILLLLPERNTLHATKRSLDNIGSVCPFLDKYVHGFRGGTGVYSVPTQDDTYTYRRTL